VDVNESVRSVVELFEPQLSAVRAPADHAGAVTWKKISPARRLTRSTAQALENLVLNSLDRHARCGTFTVRTSQHNGSVRSKSATPARA